MDYNYNEAPVTGVKKERVYAVQINNPDDNIPNMVYRVQEGIKLDGFPTVYRDLGTEYVQFDPANPKHLQLYALLEEIYIEKKQSVVVNG